MPNQTTPSTHTQYEDDELSLIDLWFIIWKRKWLILTLGPLAGIIGIFIALTSTVYYKSTVLAAPSQSDSEGGGLSALAGQFGGLASMAGINLGTGGGNIDTAIATLKSNQFISAFIKEKKLVKVLFYEDWDEEEQVWTKKSKRRGESNQPTVGETYELFSKNVLSVSQDKKTGLVTLSISWIDPLLCQQWANELVIRLNRYMQDKAKQETERNLAYLNKQLEETNKVEMKEALYTIIESESQSAMLANAKEEFVFKIIDPAPLPELPSKPNKPMIVIAAGMLGGFLGIFLCFVLHFIDVAKASKAKAA